MAVSKKVKIDMLEKLEDGTFKHKLPSTNVDAIEDLRVVDEKLEFYNGAEWKIASGGIPVGNVSGLSIKEDNAEITLMWTDPDDRYLDDIKIAEWQGTKIARKEGSYPVSDDDGVLVVDNTIKNQYSGNGYKDTGLTNETTYYYMAFPYTEDAITVDGSNRISATPIDSDDPGPSNLIGGDMQAGYFGIVPAAELYTGDELAAAVGITQGASQFSDAGWLKFAIDGKIIYKSKKTFRHSISWDRIDSKGCVDGTKTVTKDGVTYEVTLMKGANKDPAGGYQGAINHGSEWNKLMLPIHKRAKDQSWKYKDSVDTPTEDWDVGFTDEDLHTHNSHGDGTYQWCQEEAEAASLRVYRGHSGVSFSSSSVSSNTSAYQGWSPVLRVIS